MNKLILVEGLPSSGKTTIAKQIKNELSNSNYNVCYLEEHDVLNKIDITRKAFLSQSEYDKLLLKCKKISCCDKCKYDFENIKQEIEKYTVLYNDMYLVSYSQILFSDINLNKIISALYKKEKCNGNCSFKEYKKIMLDLYEKFVKECDENTIYIVDGGFLHNPFFDIIGYYNLSKKERFEFFDKLYNTIKNLNVKMIYIEMNDIENTIKKRRSTEWIKMFSNWLENSNYGKIKNLSGMSGIVDLYKYKQKVEKEIIEYLNIDCEIIYCKEVKNAKYNVNI